MRMKKVIALLLAALMGMTGCAGTQEAASETATAEAANREGEEQVDSAQGETEAGATSDEQAAQIKEASPAEDYYDWVNSNLLSEKEIPADASEWSYTYEIDMANEERFLEILQKLVMDRDQLEHGTKEQKIADFYNCALDQESREKAGIGGLSEYVERFQNASSVQEYMNVQAELSRMYGVASLNGIWGMEDMADTTKYAWYVVGADLGPGKEMLEDAGMADVMEQYQGYIAKMMQISGMEEQEAKETAAEIFAFQKDLASVSLSLADSSNPENIYNLYTTEQLAEVYTNVDMKSVLAKMGVDGRGSFIVTDVEQIKKINEYLTEDNLPLLKNYSIYCLMNDFSRYLMPEAEQAKLEYNQVISGAAELRSDEKRAYDLTNELLGFEMGQIYVERYFSEEDKKNVEQIVEDVRAVYEEKIRSLDWMQEETKKAAIRKLEKMDLKIGYPEQWPDFYKNCEVTSVEEGGSLIDNVLSLSKGSWADQMKKYCGDEVDRTVWLMTPQTVNAYYNPSMNEIVFPAGILQAPFYSPEFSEEENLGGIGAVIAHEITHAFDNTGAMYDENGNYADWWTAQDKEEFEKRGALVTEYYNGYEALEGEMVNGEQTLGENIADLGAVSCVTEIVLKDADKENLTEEDRAGLQALYQSYANTWATKMTDELTLYLLNADVHAPAKVRVNAVLSSTEGYYLAYPELKEGDAMYKAPEERVRVW